MAPLSVSHRPPLWLRILLALGLCVITAALGLAGYRYLTRLTTLTVAASRVGGASEVASALAARVSDGRKVRLKVVPTASMTEAAELFGSGKVDLAVLRADMPGQGDARAVVVVAQATALMFLPPGSQVDDLDALKGRTIGVLEAGTNARVIEALAASYGFDQGKFRPVSQQEAGPLLGRRQIQALLVVTPITEQYLAAIRSHLGFKAKQRPGLLAIDQAAAIADTARYYESYDLPKGTVVGSPPLPSEDLTTLRVPINLVARKRLNDDVVGILTRAIMDARGELAGKFPILTQIRAPETDKDAYIPLHPGAAAYYEGDEKSFFDRYGDALFYGPMIFGGIASLFAGLWRFLGVGRGQDVQPLATLAGLFGRVRAAPDVAALDAIEDEIDDLVRDEIPGWNGEDDTSESRGFSVGLLRLERAIARRRASLAEAADGETDRSIAAGG